MNRPGPNSQPLRGMPGNAFQTQQPSATRNTQSRTTLQNSKIVGNTSSQWPSMAFPQSRSHAPFDPSEFPSLSGAPQSQQSNSPSQATWGGQAPRVSQPTPVGRSQPSNIAPSSIGQPFHSSDSQHESKSPFPPLNAAGLDDYRFGDGHSRTSNRQDTSQSSRFNGVNPAVTPGVLSGIGRNGILGQGDMHQENLGPAERMMSPGGLSSSGAPSTTRSPLNQNQDALHRGQINQRSQIVGDHAGQRYTQFQHLEDGSHGGTDGQASEMSDVDKWGLEGLMSRIGGAESIDQSQLGLGMDLTMLGLDLNRPDHETLYQDWAGPFADSSIRPMIPKFQLPQAYTVTNVPPLATKISSFADDTLFTIFYSCPRDVAQDMAAAELYSRDWRWHKRLQQWLCKAKEFGEPAVLPSAKEERGHYYFFDANNWRKERKEFILNYDHLHHMQQQQQPPQPMPGM